MINTESKGSKNKAARRKHALTRRRKRLLTLLFKRNLKTVNAAPEKYGRSLNVSIRSLNYQQSAPYRIGSKKKALLKNVKSACMLHRIRNLFVNVTRPMMSGASITKANFI